MESKKVKKRGSKLAYWIGGMFVLTGVLLLGRNLGYINTELFQILVSWRMFIVVLSAYLLTVRHYFASFILFALGLFLLLDVSMLADKLADYFWPVILVIVGLALLIKKSVKPGKKYWSNSEAISKYTSENGFFNIENSFGEVRQAVVDEELVGGTIKNSFGGVMVDLRRATLPEGRTYIDVNGQFGGIEIYVPSTWQVQFEVHTFLAGCEDSRLKGFATETDRVLVIRGDISFSGIEIKS